jgi:hypothetical protein
MRGWFFYDDTHEAACTDATVCTLVPGPGTPPAGSGSAELATPNATDGYALVLPDYAGVRFDHVTTLSYSTYRQSSDAGNNLAISLQFNADYDLNDAVTGFMGRIVFEPYRTSGGSVVHDTWQTWDALNGKWWGTRSTVTVGGVSVANPCIQASPCSWGDLFAHFPNIGVHGTFGAVVLKAGSTWPGFRGNVDNLTIGVDNVNTTFDFEPGCAFNDVGSVRTLVADCQTDHTILIPDGFTLDGDGHTITAVDPAGGHFLGAVIKNQGSTASVENLTVTGSGLANVCDPSSPDTRLRGILFDGAGGSITNNTVTGVRQGLSGCQEGNAIEVRNAPFDDMGADVSITISGNTVSDYQKNGITANGSVAATITGNVVTGDGPIGYIAQNGIQVGFGATAVVRSNTVSGNDYTGPDVACGILLYQADGVKASSNNACANERDNCNFGKGGGSFNPNP